ALLVLLAVAAALCWWRRSRTSDTASDETPPTLAEWGRCGRTSSAPDYQGARRFTLEEMSHATKNFSDANLVGAGTFGKVYMGLLLDGTVVAIKRRVGAPRQDFVDEVRRQSEIWHRNVVTLIGYCQDGGLQMLVFEHLPNGSVCGHLYDTGKESMTRLEFKQRLSIAIGAAKGLDHLHSLAPPLIHKGFKTSNVLVDENFIAKVSDAGVDRLLRGLEDPGSPLNGFRSGIYQDPEAHSLAQLSASSDVYSFGVFLLELITGREAASLVSPESTESFVLNVSARGVRRRGGGPEARRQLHLGGHEGAGRADNAVPEPVSGEEAAQDAAGRGGARPHPGEGDDPDDRHGRWHCHHHPREPALHVM
uniref:non-specific serine/threonine protein kinase n=1 Tax=Aegilops tauschii subsp. strangulata TaxID=200361 RepID=A0A453GHW3_AEGTS